MCSSRLADDLFTPTELSRVQLCQAKLSWAVLYGSWDEMAELWAWDE